MGVAIPRLSKVWAISGPQLAYGQIVAWGQYIVGIGLTLALISPVWKLPAMFGVLVPIGFEGGHGTAGGLAGTFRNFGWDAGVDFCLASATAGLILAVIVGMTLVNIAKRRNWTQGSDGCALSCDNGVYLRSTAPPPATKPSLPTPRFPGVAPGVHWRGGVSGLADAAGAAVWRAVCARIAG
jgi:hypothetical protein